MNILYFLNSKALRTTKHAAVMLCAILCVFSLTSCASVQERSTPSSSQEQSRATDNSGISTNEQVDAESNERTEQADNRAGAVLGTVATIWLVTEFIEDKVVPVVISLAVAYAIYEGSRYAH